MDKEEARFVLSCFRPDGSDAADASFAEALQFAAADRELGEWLARERASDAAFADALATLTLPGDLRREILAGLAAERGELPAEDQWDVPLIDALASVKPPDGLREEILTAMRSSVGKAAAKPAGSAGKRHWKWAVPLAAAAGVALAFLLPSKPQPEGLTLSHIKQASIETLESPDFALEVKNSDQQALFRYIRDQQRTCPDGCVPSGLREVPGLGCRTLVMNGKKGALVCFLRGKDDVVHMVVFRREDIVGDLPDRQHKQCEQRGPWAITSWEELGKVIVLLSQTDQEHLGGVF